MDIVDLQQRLSQTQRVYVSEPASNQVTLYSRGFGQIETRSVVQLMQQKRNGADQSKGLFSGVFGGTATFANSPRKNSPSPKLQTGGDATPDGGGFSTLVVPEVPNSIDDQTILWGLNKGPPITVSSWEVFNPDAIEESLELCVGGYVEIYKGLQQGQGTDQEGPRELVKLAAGVLQSKNGNLIEIREQLPTQSQQPYTELSRQLTGSDKPVTHMIKAMTLPNNLIIRTFDVVPWGLTSPYIVATVNSSDLDGADLSLTYRTSGLTYKVTHSIIVDQSAGQIDFISKADVTNSTNTRFANSRVTLVEDVIRQPPTLESYEKSRYGNLDENAQMMQSQDQHKSMVRRSYKKMANRTSANPELATLSKSGGGGSLSAFDAPDVKSIQKSFPISTSVTLDPASVKSMTLFQKRLGGDLQYIHNTAESDVVFMSLYFSNPSESNPKIGTPLPTGKTLVYMKTPRGSPVVLGETWITPQHSQPNVRLNLGPATSVSAKRKLENYGTNEKRAEKFSRYSLEYTNLSEVDVSVLIRFTFEQAFWTTSGDIEFSKWGPENEGEPYSETIAKGQVVLPRNSITRRLILGKAQFWVNAERQALQANSLNRSSVSFIVESMRNYLTFKKTCQIKWNSKIGPEDVWDWVESFSNYLATLNRTNLTWLEKCPGSKHNMMHKFVVAGKSDKVSGVFLQISTANELPNPGAANVAHLGENVSFTIENVYQKSICAFESDLFPGDITTPSDTSIKIICADGSVFIHPLFPNTLSDGVTKLAISPQITAELHCFTSMWKTVTLKLR